MAFLKQAGITTVCIFRSTPADVKKRLSDLGADSIALSDRKGVVYNLFQVKRSAKSVFHGTIEGVNKKYKQYSSVSMILKETSGKDGSKAGLQLPADFCIDENGIVVDVFRAERIQDHMPLDRIEKFVPVEKRCQCSKKSCLFPRCRRRFDEIMKDSSAMLYLGDE